MINKPKLQLKLSEPATVFSIKKQTSQDENYPKGFLTQEQYQAQTKAINLFWARTLRATNARVRRIQSKLKTKRKEKKLSQEQLATLCGLSRKTIYRLETSERDLASTSFQVVLRILLTLGLKENLKDVVKPKILRQTK